MENNDIDCQRGKLLNREKKKPQDPWAHGRLIHPLIKFNGNTKFFFRKQPEEIDNIPSLKIS